MGVPGKNLPFGRYIFVKIRAPENLKGQICAVLLDLVLPAGSYHALVSRYPKKGMA